MFMNGVLGGLVGITAGADQMGPTSAIIIGAIGGAVVVLGVALLDKCKLDDPVGAIPCAPICRYMGNFSSWTFWSLCWFRPIYGSISKYWNCGCIFGNWCFYYFINSKINYRDLEYLMKKKKQGWIFLNMEQKHIFHHNEIVDYIISVLKGDQMISFFIFISFYFFIYNILVNNYEENYNSWKWSKWSCCSKLFG